MNQVLLNGNEYKIQEKDLPYLVIYGEKSGGSHFTITLIKDLFLSGSKILFFTAFPMAKDNFLEQIGNKHTTLAFVNSTEDLENHRDSQVIILDSGNEDLFINAVKNLEDIKDRVVLVKNIEAFSKQVFDSCLGLNKIIFSGHIDNCVAKEEVIKKSYKNIVIFTKPEIPIKIDIPDLEKWCGYLSSENLTGIIKVKID